MFLKPAQKIEISIFKRRVRKLEKKKKTRFLFGKKENRPAEKLNKR